MFFYWGRWIQLFLRKLCWIFPARKIILIIPKNLLFNSDNPCFDLEYFIYCRFELRRVKLTYNSVQIDLKRVRDNDLNPCIALRHQQTTECLDIMGALILSEALPWKPACGLLREMPVRLDVVSLTRCQRLDNTSLTGTQISLHPMLCSANPCLVCRSVRVCLTCTQAHHLG